MSTPQAYIAISPNSGNVLTNSTLGDLMIYGTCNTQKLLWGYSNSNAILTVSASNMSFGGSITLSNQLQLNGLIISQRQSSTINNMTFATPVATIVTGNGTFTQVSMTPGLSNAIQFINGITEIARFSSNGYLGIGTSNPRYSIESTGHIISKCAIARLVAVQPSDTASYGNDNFYTMSFKSCTTNNASFINFSLNSNAYGSRSNNYVQVFETGIYRIDMSIAYVGTGNALAIGYNSNTSTDTPTVATLSAATSAQCVSATFYQNLNSNDIVRFHWRVSSGSGTSSIGGSGVFYPQTVTICYIGS